MYYNYILERPVDNIFHLVFFEVFKMGETCDHILFTISWPVLTTDKGRKADCKRAPSLSKPRKRPRNGEKLGLSTLLSQPPKWSVEKKKSSTISSGKSFWIFSVLFSENWKYRVIKSKAWLLRYLIVIKKDCKMKLSNCVCYGNNSGFIFLIKYIMCSKCSPFL